MHKLLFDDLQNCEYENVALQAQRDVYQDSYKDVKIKPVTLLSIVMFLAQMIQVKITSS